MNVAVSLAMLLVYSVLLLFTLIKLVVRCTGRHKKVGFLSTFLVLIVVWSAIRCAIWLLAAVVRDNGNPYATEVLVLLSFASELGSMALIVLFFVKIFVKQTIWSRWKHAAKVLFITFYATTMALAAGWGVASGALRENAAQASGRTGVRRMWGVQSNLFDRIDNALFCCVFAVLGCTFFALAVQLHRTASAASEAERRVMLPIHPGYVCGAFVVLGVLHLSRSLFDFLAALGVVFISGRSAADLTDVVSMGQEALIVVFYVIWDIVPTLILLFIMQLRCDVRCRRRSAAAPAARSSLGDRASASSLLVDGAFALMLDGGGGGGGDLERTRRTISDELRGKPAAPRDDTGAAPKFGVFAAINATSPLARASSGDMGVNPFDDAGVMALGSGPGGVYDYEGEGWSDRHGGGDAQLEGQAEAEAQAQAQQHAESW
jgi:hypothetical protein